MFSGLIFNPVIVISKAFGDGYFVLNCNKLLFVVEARLKSDSSDKAEGLVRWMIQFKTGEPLI